MPKYRPLAERLWEKIRKGESDECWLWIAYTNACGYGIIARNSDDRSALAHRVVWEMEYGPIPNGMNVCHHCDNPPCCNPRHLFLGTQYDNIKDMDSKGRNNQPKGINHCRAIFTEEQVRNIKFSSLPELELVEIYGCSLSAIRHIKSGHTWKHITRNPPEVETNREQIDRPDRPDEKAWRTA